MRPLKLKSAIHYQPEKFLRRGFKSRPLVGLRADRWRKTETRALKKFVRALITQNAVQVPLAKFARF